MPRISWDDANSVSDLVTGQIPEAITAEDIERPEFLDTMSAALRRFNVVTNAYDYATRPALPPPVPGYTPYGTGELAGYEQFSHRFVRSWSPEETRQKKNQIDAELADQRTFEASGGWGLAASIAAGIVDPLTLASMAIPLAAPAAWGGRALRVGAAVGATTALDTAAEVALHQTQETRTLEESVLNIGAGALLSGLFGTIASRIPKTEFEILRRQLQQELKATSEPVSTVGAARAGVMTSLEEEGVARGGETIARTIGQISPLNRLLTSPFRATRILAQRLLEVPFLLEKNLRGVETPVAVESVIKQRISQARFNLVNDYERAFVEYSTRVKGEGALTLRAFGEEVVRALRRGDVSEVAEAQDLARTIRRVFDEDKKALQELGVLSEEFQLLGAESYFPRVYDNNAIRRDPTGLETRLRNWFTANPKLINEAQDDPKISRHAVEHETDELGGHTIRVGNVGKAEAQESGEFVQMKRIDVDESAQGQGVGLAMLANAADDAFSRGLRLMSDFSVSPAMQDVYEGLARRGYRLVKNPSDLSEETGNLVSRDPRKGVYELAAGPDKRIPVYREPAEIETAVQETIENIMGTVRGMADIGGAIAGAKPLRHRTLDVPDEILEPYLVNDLESVMNGYLRAMAPQIEFRRAFGSASLHNEMEEINDLARAAIARETDAAKKNAIRDAQSRDINNIVAMRDRLLGQVGQRGNTSEFLVRAQRLARAYNYVRLLGTQTLSSMSDYGRMLARYGLVRTARMTAKFLTNVKANRLTRDDAKRLGTALDWVIDSRGATLAEIGDELAGSRVEQMAQWASRGFSRISLMATWNSTMKAITTALEQDAILRAIKNYDSMSAFQRGKLAQVGINEDMLKRIGDQFAKHGDDSEGLARARTELWDDREAAKIVEAAILKSADTMVVTKGQGDLPLFMNSEVGKTIVQFKSFGMASVNRIMIPIAQGLAHGDAATANGLAVMLGLGAMTYIVKEIVAGREPDLDDPGRLIAEALNWSGLLGFLPDAYDPLAGSLNLPRFSRFTDRVPIESWLGPTYGTAAYALKTSESLTDFEWKQSDIHQFRRLLPLQNLFYLRRAINALEGEVGEATGAEGATRKTFVERLTELEKPQE